LCSDVYIPALYSEEQEHARQNIFFGSWWAYLLGDTARLPIWVIPSGRTIFATSNQNSLCGGEGYFIGGRSAWMWNWPRISI